MIATITIVIVINYHHILHYQFYRTAQSSTQHYTSTDERCNNLLAVIHFKCNKFP